MAGYDSWPIACLMFVSEDEDTFDCGITSRNDSDCNVLGIWYIGIYCHESNHTININSTKFLQKI